MEAIRAMDGENVGGSRVKLGFGKPVATTCVWVDGLTEHTEKQVITLCIIIIVHELFACLGSILKKQIH